MIVLCGFGIGSSESVKLRMRVRELTALSEAFSMMKSAVSYSSGDMRHLLHVCRENKFIAGISEEHDPVTAWKCAANRFFSHAADKVFAESFIDGFGKSDVNGTVAHIALFEDKLRQRLQKAEREVAEKGRLYTVLGVFFGTAAALLLI